MPPAHPRVLPPLPSLTADGGVPSCRAPAGHARVGRSRALATQGDDIRIPIAVDAAHERPYLARARPDDLKYSRLTHDPARGDVHARSGLPTQARAGRGREHARAAAVTISRRVVVGIRLWPGLAWDRAWHDRLTCRRAWPPLQETAHTPFGCAVAPNPAQSLPSKVPQDTHIPSNRTQVRSHPSGRSPDTTSPPLTTTRWRVTHRRWSRAPPACGRASDRPRRSARCMCSMERASLGPGHTSRYALSRPRTVL